MRIKIINGLLLEASFILIEFKAMNRRRLRRVLVYTQLKRRGRLKIFQSTIENTFELGHIQWTVKFYMGHDYFISFCVD